MLTDFVALDCFDVDYVVDDCGEAGSDGGAGGVGLFADDAIAHRHLYSTGKPVDDDLLSIANTPQEVN